MKDKLVKGDRKPPKRAALLVGANICICNIENFPAWVMHNIDAISHIFAAHVAAEIIRGNQPPPPEKFEDFCKLVHSECLSLVAEEGIGATRH